MSDPTYPVQVTNILGLLRDHLPDEYEALTARIAALKGESKILEEYRIKLEYLAQTAGIALHAKSVKPPLGIEYPLMPADLRTGTASITTSDGIRSPDSGG